MRQNKKKARRDKNVDGSLRSSSANVGSKGEPEFDVANFVQTKMGEIGLARSAGGSEVRKVLGCQ